MNANLIFEQCGLFAWPQIALSVLTFGFLFGYLIAWLRGELYRGEEPWRSTLEPLGGISVSLGLLGSVAGFIMAFGGFQNGVNVPQLTAGLATAYWTTGVGIVTSLVASIGGYALGLLNR